MFELKPETRVNVGSAERVVEVGAKHVDAGLVPLDRRENCV